MPNPRSILSGLAKAVEPVQETKAVGNAAIEEMLRTLDQKRLGVWDGKEPYDVWKARREAEMGVKKAEGGAIDLDKIIQASLRKEQNMAVGGAAKSAGKKLLSLIEDLSKSQKAAEKAGDIETALAKNEELKEAIRSTVNSPNMPRAKPLSTAEIQAYAERMAPQVEGKLTRSEKSAKTIAGKTQQQFKREQTLPVERKVLPGQKDPMEALPELTLEQQKGGVLLGLPGDPTLARMELSGIADVPFERPVTLHGGPRYGDDEKLWASNISAASGLLGAGKRASEQFGGAPVYASYMKMPSGFGFAQHYLESLLQYQRPDLLPKQARLALEDDIKKGFVNAQGKRVTFPDFPGFKDMGAVEEMALNDSNLRTHLADRLEKGKLYGLRPAADVQFAVSHPELTNLETGASGFTIGELGHNEPLTPSAHPTYSHDIAGKVLGQTANPIPYDLLYRDALQLIQKNPRAPEFNTLKLLGARQKIDDQLINEINEYQERMKRLVGKKDGGLATGGVPEKRDVSQLFPINPELRGEPVARTRAGVPVKDTNVIGGALQGLGETLLGAGRGAFATTLGGPADILNLLNVKSMGTPDIPYGSEFFKEILPLAPTTQTGQTAQQLGEFLPIDVRKPAEAVAAGAKKLAPTAKELLETGLEKAVAPTRMYAVPPGEVKPGKVKAPANDLGFYNPAEKAALNLQRKKGTGDAFLADLKKQPGVNDERITELGLDQFRGKPNVTREEIIAATQERRIPLQESVKRELDEGAIAELERRHDELLDRIAEAEVTGDRRAMSYLDEELQDNIAQQKALKSVDEAKFSPSQFPDYSMLGGTDYREIRVKLPIKRLTEDEARAVLGEKSDAKLSAADITHAQNQAQFRYELHHGDEPNVLLHLRVANHADQEGKNGLLIDELQSDWHQQGREKGYRQEPISNEKYQLMKDKIFQRFDSGEINREQRNELLDLLTNKFGAVPDAPFKDNWYQLGLKRAIKEAADTGMDRVYLTTGKRQIDRYENALRANVDAIEYEPYKGDNGELLFEISGVKNGQEVINKEGLTYKELEELVGKDMASKMKSNAGESLADERPMRPHWMRLSGDNLSIGGEGMKQWYDKTYKNYLEKYAKQHGSKLGTTNILKKSPKDLEIYKNYLSNTYGKDTEAYKLMLEEISEPVYYIDITPQMKESAKKGQSYAEGGAVRMAQGGVVDLDKIVLNALSRNMAEGGAAYNTNPDMSDGGQLIQGDAF